MFGSKAEIYNLKRDLAALNLELEIAHERIDGLHKALHETETKLSVTQNQLEFANEVNKRLREKIVSQEISEATTKSDKDKIAYLLDFISVQSNMINRLINE